jgi:radical SAM superfamily enzyme YgiQ (UPF0313 family)
MTCDTFQTLIHEIHLKNNEQCLESMMNTLLIQPKFPLTFWSFKYALQFVSKEVCNPPLGLITVAAMLPEDWTCKLIDLNIHVLTDEDLNWADIVLITAMNVQRDSAHEVIHRAKQAGKTIVAGGPMFTGEYQDFPEVDHFVLNEAEITLPHFLEDFAAGKAERVYATDDFADLALTPSPRWDLLDLYKYDSMNVQFSRGCPFNCDFCNVTALLGHRPRTKSVQQLITEIDALYTLGWRRNIFLVDDNFIGNKKILKEEILPALIEWRKDKKGCLFLTEVSINLADDDELVELMVKAGFISVFIGIETPDDASLAACNKKQNQKRDLMAAVHKLQEAGLQVMAGFIVGFDSDTETIFDRQIDFIQESGIVTAMVGLLQAPYGTALYDRMKDENRLLTEMSGNNADGETNIIPLMPKELLANGYRKIISTIYSPQQFYARVQTFLEHYHPVTHAVTIEPNEIIALFRTIWHMGIIGPERKYYWKLFFWTLFHRPDSFPIAITLTVYGYHFGKVRDDILFHQQPETVPVTLPA